MAMAISTPEPQAVPLERDKVSEFDHGMHSADQPTATDQPVVRPSSSEADATATGTY